MKQVIVLLAISIIYIYCEDICFLPHIGRSDDICDVASKAYFFNNLTDRCEGFVYRGCGHNENYFSDLRTCRERCEDRICKLPLDLGGYCAASHYHYYNLATRSCEIFTYGGCGGNANKFLTHDKCMDKCSHVGFY